MFGSVTPNERELRAICELVNTKLGMKFGKEKYPLITSRLGKHLRELGFEDYQPYLELVKRDPEEETLLINLLTTNVTHFFREPWQFQYLKENVVPAFLSMRKNNGKIIRGWSAGCATGEEAYTLGMVLLDRLPSDWSVKVLASDICTSSLNYASQGVYTGEQVQDIPNAYLSKFFTNDAPDAFRVRDALRKTIFFRRINLNETSDLLDNVLVDFIFCRNVFIYFSKETQARVIDHFYKHLLPGGYLFLGHSESIDSSHDSRWESLKGCVYRKR